MHGSLPRHRHPIFDNAYGPWRSRPYVLYRRQIQRAIPVVAALGALALFILVLRLLFGGNEPPPLPIWPLPPADDGPARSEYYTWSTTSAFNPVNQDTEGRSVADLCASFPHAKLETIQPVLKLGHYDIGTKALDAQLNTVSACLDNLLIFSDLDDPVPGGRKAIDVLADLPASYLANADFGNYTYMKELRRTGALDVDKDATASINGWILDKYKFLPMIERAWDLAPGKAWYVFFETDTYIFWDNMLRFLENFDPDTPQYMGSPSPGRVVPETEHRTWFANGGPGFVLSRAAVQKMLVRKTGVDGDYLEPPMSHRWADILSHDCCGDSVLGWVLHHAGVPFKGFWPLFNPHSLHTVPFSTSYWCQPMLTLHKTRPDDMLELWRWEHRRRQLSKPLIYMDLYDVRHPGKPSIRNDWDNSDFVNTLIKKGPETAASFDECGTACEKNPKCFQWTFHSGKCRLVDSMQLGAARAMTEATEEDPGGSYASGWLTERIDDWREAHTCKEVQWVRPSIERIY
ncbi:hypothetical protein B0T11DRAFT_257212 [Plectosphaerella cucumerina]|uniref:N-acetylgalactosaminide beta-1,3-galactosyltransferase n=1 Tax=Plectosphaerella cucumerina TaxID=40658 RepID=A0A8K0TNM1_9PEZI|nr:hypothetical protein B0T11DRAFT_257212 [Plectosphaerella cucumerina]